LVKQFELAKLDEGVDSTIIQVIDKAVLPEKKAKPKRILIVIVAAFAGFFIAVFAAFFKEFLGRSSDDPETRVRLEEFKRLVRSK